MRKPDSARKRTTLSVFEKNQSEVNHHSKATYQTFTVTIVFIVNDLNVGPFFGFITFIRVEQKYLNHQKDEKLPYVDRIFVPCDDHTAKCSIFYESHNIQSWAQYLFFLLRIRFELIHSIAAGSLLRIIKKETTLSAIQNYWNDFINMYFLCSLLLLLCLARLLRFLMLNKLYFRSVHGCSLLWAHNSWLNVRSFISLSLDYIIQRFWYASLPCVLL